MSLVYETEIHCHDVDLSSVKHVKKFATEWLKREEPLHCLINCAGDVPTAYHASPENIEVTLACVINQAYLLAGMLMPALVLVGGQIINVTSAGATTVKLDFPRLNAPFEGNTEWSKAESSAAQYRYAHAKRAMLMVSKHMATMCAKLRQGEDLDTPLVRVHAMHPGWVNTQGLARCLPKFHADNKDVLRSAAEGADTIIWLATSPLTTRKSSGGFWFERAPADTDYSFAGTAAEAADYTALWKACAEWTGWVFEGRWVVVRLCGWRMEG